LISQVVTIAATRAAGEIRVVGVDAGVDDGDRDAASRAQVPDA
jgi:hypothetical protein